MLDLGERILLNDGTSIVEDDYAVELLLSEGKLPEHIKVVSSKDSDLFEQRYRTKITHGIEDIDLHVDLEFDEDELLGIIEKIIHTRRDDTSLEDHNKRVEQELAYFVKYDFQHILIKLDRLVKSFKENKVTWGVGRGSSCACYVFFLMGVHDINPIKYDIDFKEFSKED